MVTDDSTDTCIDVVMLTGLSLSKLHDITRFVGTRLTATSSIIVRVQVYSAQSRVELKL